MVCTQILRWVHVSMCQCIHVSMLETTDDMCTAAAAAASSRHRGEHGDAADAQAGGTLPEAGEEAARGVAGRGAPAPRVVGVEHRRRGGARRRALPPVLRAGEQPLPAGPGGVQEDLRPAGGVPVARDGAGADAAGHARPAHEHAPAPPRQGGVPGQELRGQAAEELLGAGHRVLHLIRKDLASVAEVSERPGLSSGAGVTTEALSDFYSACDKFAKLEPWNRLAERQAIQVDAVGEEELRLDARHQVGRGTVFSSVISTHTDSGPNGEGGDHIRGLALFYTRADLERRVLPPGEQLALMENPELRRCAKCDKRAAPGKELKRCTRCKCTFYCDAQCQRGHWKDHKVSCTPPGDISSGAGEKKITWGAKEMSILYGPQTSVPFDDLDAIVKHSLPIPKVKGEALYPSAVVFRKGDPSVPDITELTWLTRALSAQIEIVSNQPLFMQNTMGELLGLDEHDGEQRKVELKCKTFGFNDELVIRNSTVLTMHDVERLRKVIQKQQAGAETIAEGDEADDNKEPTEGAKNDKAESDEDDDGSDLQDGEKGCIVM
ncbi:unnamed protein product [Phytophthora fragariaefolia]|uniref:Unnamed protein product n=1 Tax=Phytophthora fragariaefolia TaxID=1490495 RepID=A0A9W6XPV9_9STRA|nr:unnamed protein product [Phytophthora fragariaefolia]